MEQIIELVDRDINVVVNFVFYIFKKIKEILNIISRDIENVIKI